METCSRCRGIRVHDPVETLFTVAWNTHLEQPHSQPLAIPLRDPSTPALSLWELKAIKRSKISAQNVEDPELLRRALKEVSEEGTNVSKLRRNRRAARRDAWRAVEQLADSALPNTSLQPTLVSNDVESLPWEVLETARI
jgi:hypothetical protein